MIPTIDIFNDVADIDDILPSIREYLDLFKNSKLTVFFLIYKVQTINIYLN